MATLTLRGLRKSYGAAEVIKGIDLDIADRELVVFVGPSGCGKSTLLRMIAGLEHISGGELTIDGQRVNEVGPADRGLAMVFQSYALYPHMTVRQNMGFALRLAGTPRAERDRKVEEAARILQLEPYLERRPKDLSGGQRQRVAIGRAIVRQPKVFLFDEPLSNLDAALRGQTRVELLRLHEDLKATMIYVTHDQVEAMTMADKIVVLQAGQVEQVGSPLELYHHPANLFVAGFIGSPPHELPFRHRCRAGARQHRRRHAVRQPPRRPRRFRCCATRRLGDARYPPRSLAARPGGTTRRRSASSRAARRVDAATCGRRCGRRSHGTNGRRRSHNDAPIRPVEFGRGELPSVRRCWPSAGAIGAA